MNTIKVMVPMISLGILSACGADSGSSQSPTKAKTDIGSFKVEIAGVMQFDETGNRAGSFTHRNDYWEYKANGAKLRMAGRFPEDSLGVEQASIDLEYNNVYLEFMLQVKKKNTKVSCKAAQDPVGQIKRTVHADLSNSGSFNIELVQCKNKYTSETIVEIATPIVVKGQFTNTPNKESLF